MKHSHMAQLEDAHKATHIYYVCLSVEPVDNLGHKYDG